jgi:hypothetical protein
MKKVFLLAVLAILLVGGGAILAVLYFTGPSGPSPAPVVDDTPQPERGYVPAMPAPSGPSGPTGSTEQPPANLRVPAGVPMQPQPDPRAEKMEAIRQEKFESGIDALNRRTEERLRRAKSQPQPPPQRPVDSTQR